MTDNGTYVVDGLTTVTIADAASIAQLTTIDGLTDAALVVSAITDAADNIVNDDGTVLSTFVGTATNVTVTDAATVAQLTAIAAQATGGTLSYTLVSDDPDNIVAEDGTGLSVFVTGSVAVTLTAQPTLAQLVAINNATSGEITLQITSGALSGTASDLVAAFTGTITEYTGDLTITDAASVSELTSIEAATTGAVTYTAVSDLADNMVADDGTGLNSYINTDVSRSVTIEDQATLEQLVAINAATLGTITLNVTAGALSGTSADLALAFAGEVTAYSGVLTATDTATVSQATTINSASALKNAVYSITGDQALISGALGTEDGTDAVLNALTVTANGTSGADSINMTSFTGVNTRDLIINAGARNDQVFGGAGNDVINGETGDDILGGGAGADTFDGGFGDDIFSIDNAAETQTVDFDATDADFSNIDTIVSFNTSTEADTIEIASGVAFFSGLTFAGNASIAVDAVSVASAATFQDVFDGITGAAASTASAAQFYHVTIAAGALQGEVLVLNDGTAGIDANDMFISMTTEETLTSSHIAFF